MSELKWRIRESGNGDYIAELGIQHKGGVLAHNGIGYTMPAFIVYEYSRFSTRKEAERYINRKSPTR